MKELCLDLIDYQVICLSFTISSQNRFADCFKCVQHVARVENLHLSQFMLCYYDFSLLYSA